MKFTPDGGHVVVAARHVGPDARGHRHGRRPGHRARGARTHLRGVPAGAARCSEGGGHGARPDPVPTTRRPAGRSDVAGDGGRRREHVRLRGARRHRSRAPARPGRATTLPSSSWSTTTVPRSTCSPPTSTSFGVRVVRARDGRAGLHADPVVAAGGSRAGPAPARPGRLAGPRAPEGRRGDARHPRRRSRRSSTSGPAASRSGAAEYLIKPVASRRPGARAAPRRGCLPVDAACHRGAA